MGVVSPGQKGIADLLLGKAYVEKTDGLLFIHIMATCHGVQISFGKPNRRLKPTYTSSNANQGRQSALSWCQPPLLTCFGQTITL